MIKPNKYFDIFILLLLAVSLFFTFYRHYSDGFVISINNILALVLFIGGVFFIFKNQEKGNYVVIILLILATIKIINFTIAVSSIHIGNLDNNGDSLDYGYPGLDPLFFLIFLIYWIINRKAIRLIWDRLYHGSEKEQEDKFNIAVDFYYNKFNSYEADQLNDVLKMLKDYPAEAQYAIKKIHDERKVSLLS